jgi:hypothetical protein
MCVAQTLVLEGRSAEELPERHMAAWTFRNVDTSLPPQPDAWPMSASDVPGTMVGSYTVGRAAEVPGSWQSTRLVAEAQHAVGSPPARRRSLWSLS